MAYKARYKVSCKLTTLIGTEDKFFESELPTLNDVLKYVLFHKSIEENDDNLRQTSEKMWASAKDLWQKANPLITIISDKRRSDRTVNDWNESI